MAVHVDGTSSCSENVNFNISHEHDLKNASYYSRSHKICVKDARSSTATPALPGSVGAMGAVPVPTVSHVAAPSGGSVRCGLVPSGSVFQDGGAVCENSSSVPSHVGFRVGDRPMLDTREPSSCRSNSANVANVPRSVGGVGRVGGISSSRFIESRPFCVRRAVSWGGVAPIVSSVPSEVAVSRQAAQGVGAPPLGLGGRPSSSTDPLVPGFTSGTSFTPPDAGAREVICVGGDRAVLRSGPGGGADVRVAQGPAGCQDPAPQDAKGCVMQGSKFAPTPVPCCDVDMCGGIVPAGGQDPTPQGIGKSRFLDSLDPEPEQGTSAGTRYQCRAGNYREPYFGRQGC